MAEKQIELIYSQQAGDFIAGRAYSNPRFFTTPRANVSKVLLVGEWPAIRAAYEALGVPVERLDAEAATAPPPEAAKAPASLVPTLPADERGKVYIPEDWESLPWSKPTDAGLTLRGLAAVFADTPVLNKAHAVEAIKAEISRRSVMTGDGSGNSLPSGGADEADMREHIHAPAHDEHVHQPAWNEPSVDAEGRGVADVSSEG